jgi:hypothetical protein
MIKRIFVPLGIDLVSGWNEKKEQSVFEKIAGKLEPICRVKTIWKTHLRHCLELVQSLVILPFKIGDDSDIISPLKLFLIEWQKIDNEIRSDYSKLYVLQILVDLLAENHPKSSTILPIEDEQWMGKFRRDFNGRISKYLQYWQSPILDSKILVGSLLLFSIRLRTVLGIEMEALAKKQKIKEAQLGVSSPLELFSVFDAHFPLDLSKEISPFKPIIVWIWNTDTRTHQKIEYKFTKEQLTKIKSLRVIEQAQFFANCVL